MIEPDLLEDEAPVARGLSASVLAEVESGRLESLDATALLHWALARFHPRLVLSCSFGAPEGLVLLDSMLRIEPSSRVFLLDTGRLPQATHDLVDRVRERYGVQVEVVLPDAHAVQDMVRRHGQNLFYESVEHRRWCCRLRKVEPMRRYFAEAGIDAWVAGLRREQGVTRRDAPKVEIDVAHGGRIKINPLADWSEEQVWTYVREHNVPVNRLHREGYPSVGCDPCSRAIQPGDDIRAGRWWWESAATRECGIHVGEEKDGSGI
ncbi:MAG: phosphoadenylyl-sulfate reductase [Myxococcota bacterium]|nr:phosphoadenylyl-sulfate reductase [Myxococcota bacterium]